jgi:hypothetical protein
MPRLAEISYSREATIAAVRAYYQFLTKLYLSESSIIEPPEGGWPQITKESIGYIGKTDEVLELLRHLPYIRFDGEYETPQVAPGTRCVDWPNLAKEHYALAAMRRITDGDEWEHVPSHIVGLTMEARSSFSFNLDTKLGVIYWIKCPLPLRQASAVERVLNDPETYAPEEELVWRDDGPAWAISDLFEQLKEEFRQLNFVPMGPRMVDDDYSLHSGTTGDGATDTVREVYREYGWPDLDKYRKEECLVALKKTLQEKYPDRMEEFYDEDE